MHPSSHSLGISVRALAAVCLLCFAAVWPSVAAAQTTTQITARSTTQNKAAAAAPATDPALAANPKYMEAMAEARQMERRRQYGFAEDDYRKANKIADGKDPNSLHALFALQLRRGSYKDALKTVDALAAIGVLDYPA